jgi:2,3,4,5-tetrahydropyridine-2-carboxylate N-succinyltransferase
MSASPSPDVDLVALARRVEELFELPSSDLDDDAAATVEQVLDLLDEGHVRVAAPGGHGADASTVEGAAWRVNDWAKKAILLSFRTRGMQTTELGPYEYHDKMKLKTGYAARGVRVVPPAVARHGAHLAAGVVLMPSYVNVGAYVGAGTMVDTWATVGSCAQIGADVHLSGGVGIGGVLEPLQATPVIVEDGAFVGSRCIVVEGVRVGREAVLGANVVLTASTPIIDVRAKKAVEMRGVVPPRCVVVPGTRKKRFPAGKFSVPCALIIGERSASTDRKTSLTDVLREFAVSV